MSAGLCRAAARADWLQPACTPSPRHPLSPHAAACSRRWTVAKTACRLCWGMRSATRSAGTGGRLLSCLCAQRGRLGAWLPMASNARMVCAASSSMSLRPRCAPLCAHARPPWLQPAAVPTADHFARCPCPPPHALLCAAWRRPPACTPLSLLWTWRWAWRNACSRSGSRGRSCRRYNFGPLRP